MCGLAGSVNFPLDLLQLNHDLFHRGPDEQSNYENGSIRLYHYRLAILDLTGGRQPMHHNDLTIIFNGEIYNHREVRKKLGIQCTTNSDTETILRAYEKIGPSCLQEFDGMFAFIIHDKKKNLLFLARDRAGKKPLYYYSHGGRFVFASELNAIQRQLKLEINEENLRNFIRLGYFYKSTTPYKDVWELPAGCYAEVSAQLAEPKVTQWWRIHDYYEKRSSDDFATALQKVDQYLHQAVHRRVESSDLEVGSFLSGGIDSGLVSAIAKNYNATLKTFTVSFDSDYDEAPLAKLVADRYHTKHHEIRISYKHLLDDVETILSNYGEPFFDSSAIPSYYVSQEAKKYLTVILNGDGGDELFGGYRRYVPFARYDFFNPGVIVKNSASVFHSVLPVPHDKKSTYNYVYRLSDLARKSNISTYLSATIDSFEGFEKHIKGAKVVLKEMKNDFDSINQSNLTGLQKIMNLDFDNLLAGDLLVKMDIATMAHSLEGRSPLLSKELMEYVPTLPDKFKIKGKQTKFLLRKLAEKYLPVELIHQPKRGFEVPLKKWVDHELKEMIASYLLAADAFVHHYVSPAFISELWAKRINAGDEKRAKMLWTLFALEVWYKKCYLPYA